MSLDLNDPRLTAYALNELEPREREEFERLLAHDPAARELIEDLQKTADFLTAELAKEPAPEVHVELTAPIATPKTEPVKRAPKLIWFPIRHKLAWACGIAAAAMLVVGLLVTETSGRLGKPRATGSYSVLPERSEQLLKESYAGAKIAEDGAFMAYNEPLEKQREKIQEAREVLGREEKVEILSMQAPPLPATPAPQSMLNLAPSASLQAGASTTAIAPGTVVGGSGALVISGQSRVRMYDEMKDSDFEVRAAKMKVAKAEASDKRDFQGFINYGQPVQIRSEQKNAIDLLTSPTLRVKNGEDATITVSRTFYYKTAPDSPAKPSGDLSVVGRFFISPTSNTESYNRIEENTLTAVSAEPLSTFSIDVDTASYANVRRFIEGGQRPPRDAVRIEEMLNYFTYNYTTPKGNDPFAANVEIADCPWNLEHRLVRIGIKGREIARNERPPGNLVFLVDVSGSMTSPDKLPLVRASLQMLVNKLRPTDRIAIVVYAGNSGLVLPSTTATAANKPRILEALGNLEAGGSTNGGEGIQLAYSVARENFIKGGTNRVILCTDGDFNVGVTSQGDLVSLIEQKAKSGVFLSVLGFGTGNLKDSTMVMLADKGNGNYSYIDSLKEGRKVLVEQMGGTLVTIAKDVKIQIEFNPTKVGAYRLIGYEKRLLAKEDFNDDRKDAGEIGAGHTVTALYEIVPAGKPVKTSPPVDPLKYQQNPPSEKPSTEERGVGQRIAEWFSNSEEMLTLKIRYKQPDGTTSKKLEFPITDKGGKLEEASGDFKFAAAVATWGLVLRESAYRGEASYDLVLRLAREGKGEDEEGYRSEFIRLVRQSAELP